MFQKYLFIIISFLILSGCTKNAQKKDSLSDMSKSQNTTINTTPTPSNDYNPTYDADILTTSPLLLSTYTSQILTKDPDRYHNITLVEEKLNGYTLQDGEEFSFNGVCGPYGEEEGFKEASILLSNGEHDEGYGGGVCQLSSTLYNAVKDLNVNITEQHHHSAPVGYVPENQDATISISSGLDFKFINQTGAPLLFKATSTEKKLTVEVYTLSSAY